MAANFAAFLCVLMGFGMFLTSCQGSEDITLKQAAPITIEKEVPVPYLVEKDKLVYINQTWNSWFDGSIISINGNAALTVDVEHTRPVIEMAAADHKAATITSSDELRWEDNNGQITNGQLSIIESKDGSYTIMAALVPASEYSTITKLHAKVSQVTCYYILSGTIVFHGQDGDISNPFEFKLKRSYLLVDPSIDYQIVERTDTVEKLVIQTDTVVVEKEVEKIIEKIINNTDTVYVDKIVEVPVVVNHTDTLTIEIEKFIKGADINKSVVNDFGFSVGTITLGDKQLLKIMLNHKEPVLNVEESVLGNVSFTGAGNLVWNGTDGQQTNGSKETNNITIKDFSYVRNEYTKISDNMYIVKTIYSVSGSFYNENNDLCEFSMELAPSYLQKYDAPVVTPQVEDKFAWEFTDKLTYENANGVCKGMLKVTGEKKNLRTGEVVATANLGRTNVIKIGHPTGLELFVKSTDIIGYDKDIRPYSGDDANWTGTTEKSGFEITKQTMIYEFSTWFAADAVNNGKVGPQTQLYFLSCEVSFKDPETGEVVYHKVFEKNATSNSEEFITEDALVGQTRVESDKTYKYEKSYKRTFKAYIDGQEIFAPEAISSLWTPVK